MREIILMLLIILGLFLAVTPFDAYGYDNGDFQIWHIEGQEKKINKDTKITVEEELRWGDNANQLYYHHYDIGFACVFNKNFDLSLNYRHIYERKKGKFRLENEPNINAILKWDLWESKFSDRHRLEYRHFDYQSDSWRYRNMFSVKFPWKFTKMEIQPYLTDEIFINFSGAAFTNNRFYCGFGLNLTKNIKGEIYYLLQHTRTLNKNSTNWPFINALGIKLKISL
jgi:hypothetical protein